MFSIIVPVYQVEKYLIECIESVLKQSFQDYVLILVDDGSLDQSALLCDGYITNEKVSIIHKNNGGLSDARNYGLKLASGNYVIFLDSDDYWIDTSFLDLASELISKKQPDLVLFQAEKYIEETGDYVPDVLYDADRINSIPLESALKYIISIGAYSMAAYTKIIRRKCLVDSNISFMKGLLGEDLDWYINLLLHIKSIAALETVNYVYRLRSGSITHSFGSKNMHDWVWSIKKWAGIIPETKVSQELQECCYAILAYAYVVALLNYQYLNAYERKIFWKDLKHLHWLLYYSAGNKRIKLTSICYSCFGLVVTSKLLKLYHSRRR